MSREGKKMRSAPRSLEGKDTANLPRDKERINNGVGKVPEAKVKKVVEIFVSDGFFQSTMPPDKYRSITKLHIVPYSWERGSIECWNRV